MKDANDSSIEHLTREKLKSMNYIGYTKTVFGNFFIFFGGRVHFTTYAVFHVDHAGTKIFPKNRPEVGTNRTFIEIGHFPDLGHTWS